MPRLDAKAIARLKKLTAIARRHPITFVATAGLGLALFQRAAQGSKRYGGSNPHGDR